MKNKFLLVISMLLIVNLLIPMVAFAQTSDVHTLCDVEKVIKEEEGVRGYDDDAIYYTSSNYYHYWQIGDNFPKNIRVTVERNGHYYTGTLSYSYIYTCYGTSCVGYYTGALYFVR